ncbi:MAG: hypothetical protein FWC97_11045, partial [Treponema sp.]|nr:hypothetical protein [Treponema sp.]
MKVKILVLVIAIIALFVSCQRGNRPEAGNIEIHENGFVYDASGVNNPSWTIRGITWSYRLEGEDTGDETTRVIWRGNLDMGQPIMTGETRQMTFVQASGTSSVTFTKARLPDGEDILVLPGHIAVGGQLAVITGEETFLFGGPRHVAVTGTILSRGTVVAYYPETETDGFVQVRGHDYGRTTNALVAAPNNYILRSALSTRDTDVQSAILLRTALAQPDAQAVRRDALLSMALTQFPDSVFHADIAALVHPTPAAAGLEEAAV